MSNFPRLDETGLTHLVDKLAEKILPNKNVQSDWNESDSTSDAYIKNKPSNVYTTNDIASATINDTDYIPMSDANGNRKKTLWSNIVNKLKSIFNPPVADIVNVYGAKNLIPYPYDQPNFSVQNGITFNVDSDGVISVTGTKNNNNLSQYYIVLSEAGKHGSNGLGIERGKSYTLSGCPSGGSNSTYQIRIIFNYDAEGYIKQTVVDTGNGKTFTVNVDVANIRIMIDYFGDSGTTYGNLTFKPMLRLASIEDNTYVPYAKTNKQLTDDSANKKDLTNITATGATNTTGSQITSGTYFYLNDTLVKAKANIAVNATFTLNTNYEIVTAGGLNNLTSQISNLTQNKILWEGAMFMAGNQSINLSQQISKQSIGIVLCWSAFESSSAQNYDFAYHFIPKSHIQFFGSGKGIDFSMETENIAAHKYLYIFDDHITGYDSNASSSSTGLYSKIVHTNNHWVLRQVIGV